MAQQEIHSIVFEIDGAPLYFAGVVYQQHKKTATVCTVDTNSRALNSVLHCFCCAAYTKYFRHSAKVMKYAYQNCQLDRLDLNEWVTTFLYKCKP